MALVVHVTTHGNCVVDELVRHELKADRHVTEGQVEVDEQGLGSGAREVAGEVGRQGCLADAALRREDGDDLASSVAGPPLWSRRREVRSRLRRSASTRAVWSSAVTTSRTPLLRLGQRGDVDAVTQEDDAQFRSVQPRRLRQLARLFDLHLQANDDLLDAGVFVQGPCNRRSRVEWLGVRPQRERYRSIAVVGVPEDVHGVWPGTMVGSLTESLGFTLPQSPEAHVQHVVVDTVHQPGGLLRSDLHRHQIAGGRLLLLLLFLVLDGAGCCAGVQRCLPIPMTLTLSSRTEVPLTSRSLKALDSSSVPSSLSL